MTQCDIMVVDDNPANLRLLADMLVQQGYKVRSFPLGRLALAGAMKRAPDLILLDINMPEMNGYEVCKCLKSTEELSAIPVIFLSALNETQDKIKAFQSGAVDYISKPFQFEEVHARVETHLKLHGLERALRLQNERLEEAVAARTHELAERVQQAEAARRNLEDEIQEHRRTDAALKESEERYRVVAETATDAIVTIDEGGTIRFANRAAERIFGHGIAKMLGQSLTMLMPKHLRHRHVARFCFSQYLATEQRHNDWEPITLPGLHESGKEIPLEVSIGEYHKDGKRSFTGIVRDITERKQAEEVLRQSEVQYRLLFQLNPHPMWVYSKESLRFLAVNNAACQDYGYSTDEFLTMTLPDICPADSTSARADFTRVTTTALPTEQTRLYQKKGGALVTAEVTEHPIPFAGQDALLAIATDITERKHLEEQFHQAQRLESVGRLAGGVAHDFNNLLTVINGYADMVITELPEDSSMRDSLGQIRLAGERAAVLTKQLLAFSRRQLVHPTVVNINSIVLDVQTMLQRLIGEDIGIRATLAPDLGHVLVDAGQLQQIIMNLAVNSRDAMPDGGTLTIKTCNHTFDATDAGAHQGVGQGPHAMLSVTDTGTGMSREVQERIFEPFFTTKPQGVGTGLGLATVYGVVKQAGGWIWVYSEPGFGTTFKIYFPLIDQPLPETRTIVETNIRGDETILIVEDQAEILGLALSALKKCGYTVYGAGSGDEALRFTRDFAGTIDLVVTDVVMPGMNGRELVTQLRPLRPNVRVLYTSGYTDDVIARHGVLEAGVAYLEKPFTPTSLGKKVRDILGSDRGSE